MLKSIKTIKCPICGCTEIVEESIETSYYGEPRINQHCNGTRWEHRKFLCGYRVEFIPNSLKEFEGKNSECFYNPEVIARKEKEKQDRDRIIRLLSDNNISEELIARVKLHCLY